MKPALHLPAYRFSKKNRLTTKAEYTEVFDSGLKVSLGWFLALYKKNEKALSRIGIIVSKRIVKKATSRNYLKRMIREGFRVRQPKIKGLDIVIMARKGCKVENKAKLQKELDTLWQQLTSI